MCRGICKVLIFFFPTASYTENLFKDQCAFYMNTIKVVNIIPQSPKLSSPNPSSPVSIEMDGSFIDFSGSRCSSLMCWSISGRLYLCECDVYTVCSTDLYLSTTHNLLHMEKMSIPRVTGGNYSQERLTHVN